MRWKREMPTENGEYIVTTATGRVTTLQFTVEGGWNTFIMTNGTLSNESAFEPDDVRGWMPMPKAMPDPAKYEFEIEWGREDE